jgi:RNA polymerase sigma-70 factor (ECF subfamily)
MDRIVRVIFVYCDTHLLESGMTEPDWQAILTRVNAGEQNAFSEIVVAYQSAVRSFLAARLNNFNDVDDLAQEVFVTAYGSLPTFRGDSSLSTWLRGIAKNHLRNHLRKRSTSPTTGGSAVLDALEPEIERQEEQHHADVLMDALRSCVARLTDDDQRLVEGRFVQNKDLSELRDLFGIKHSALTMALHRLRHRLKECVFRHIGKTDAEPGVQA